MQQILFPGWLLANQEPKSANAETRQLTWEAISITIMSPSIVLDENTITVCHRPEN